MMIIMMITTNCNNEYDEAITIDDMIDENA